MYTSYPTRFITMDSEHLQKSDSAATTWGQLRRFVVFQIKLYVEAIRDVFLSGLALFAFVIDLVLRLKGEQSLFEKLLQLGRKSERAINLFNQHDHEQTGVASIDGIVREVEDRFKQRK